MANIFDLFDSIRKDPPEKNLPFTHMVVGLGNPGKQYEWTRHNAGFLAIDFLAEQQHIRIDRTRFQALTGECIFAGVRVLFLKPQTFMNLSGVAVREAADFYRIVPENIAVISDDINLDVGRLRVRTGGSHGGHNGLKSIISELGSDAFLRMRVGVGSKRNPTDDLADWVLSTFSKEDREKLTAAFPKICSGIELLFQGKAPEAMQLCNGK